MPIDLCVTFALMILVIGLDLLLPRMVHYCELPDHGLLVDFQVSQPCCAFGDYWEEATNLRPWGLPDSRRY